MRKISCNFLFVVGLMMAISLGATTLAVAKDDKVKIPKNMSMISVQTDEPMTVYLDGLEMGKTEGNQIRFEKVVAPGNHEVRVVSADGKETKRTLSFPKNARQCICFKTVRKTIETPCPYNISVSGPDKAEEGDLITFFASNSASGTSSTLNYIWRVTPSGANITSGLGTSSITVDTSGLGRQTVRAEVDVSDGFNDAQCRQRISVTTPVSRIPPPEPKKPELFDKIIFRIFDDDKARLDNYAVALQNRPDTQGYIIVYQGPKVGKKVVDADKMAKRSLDYLVKVRGIDPRRIVVTNGGNREATMGDLWVVPPSAQPPVPTPR